MPANKPALTVTPQGGVGGTLRVQGMNFLCYEQGGQPCFLYVAQPTGNPQDGFYSPPIEPIPTPVSVSGTFKNGVAEDGAFDVSYSGVLTQNGTGFVSVTQYDPRNDKYTSLRENYTV